MPSPLLILILLLAAGLRNWRVPPQQELAAADRLSLPDGDGSPPKPPVHRLMMPTRALPSRRVGFFLHEPNVEDGYGRGWSAVRPIFRWRNRFL